MVYAPKRRFTIPTESLFYLRLSDADKNEMLTEVGSYLSIELHNKIKNWNVSLSSSLDAKIANDERL